MQLSGRTGSFFSGTIAIRNIQIQSALIDDQRNTGQSKVKIRRPTALYFALLHNVKSHCIGQGEILIGKSPQQKCRAGMLCLAD